MYKFDEVVFDLPADVAVESAEIEENFAEWWEYGKRDPKPDEKEPDQEPDPIPGSGEMSRKELTEAVREIQAQNAMLEECLIEMSEVVYA